MQASAFETLKKRGFAAERCQLGDGEGKVSQPRISEQTRRQLPSGNFAFVAAQRQFLGGLRHLLPRTLPWPPMACHSGKPPL